MKIRLIVTVCVLFAFGFIKAFSNSASTLILGNAAGMQMDSSNAEYFAFDGIREVVSNFGSLFNVLLLGIIFYTWVTYLVKLAETKVN